MTLAPSQPRYGTIMVSESSDGPLWIRVLGRDEADAQLLAKVGRSVLYKDAGPKMHLTRLSEVEHEAYVTLLAERADVHVPPVVVAGVAGPSAALLVIRPVDGTRLRTSIRRRSPTPCSTTSGSRSAGCTTRASRTAS